MKENKTRLFLSRYSIFLVFILAFLVMLPSWNKYWAPYDEGNYLVSARMVASGMVPYRDFFLIMYPPAYPYALAALHAVFGVDLLPGRIYTIILLSAICACVFYITRKITSFKYSLIAFITCLSTMAAWGEPPIPRPIWPGVAFSLLAVAFIMNFIENGKTRYLIFSSFFVGLTTIFRHDIGFLTFAVVAIGLLTYSVHTLKNEKRAFTSVMARAFKFWIIYAIFPFLFLTGLAIWLSKVNALEEAQRALFTLPLTFHKWADVPFPQFSFDFSMIFHRGCLFIRRNKFI